MDNYFERVHGLPSELKRLIFEFATLRGELLQVQLRPPARLVRPWNIVFFRNWYYILDRIDGDGTYYIYDSQHRVRAMYSM